MQQKKCWDRILIVRTDRIGDVLLSTPVIKAVREAYPNAYIAMMVSPYARDIVEGNPNLSEVIVYDKAGAEKSWWGSAKFSLALRKKHFDLAIILHPTNPNVAWVAAIGHLYSPNKERGIYKTSDGGKTWKQ